MALVGIPHGAIDHVLFFQNTKRSPILFYTLYFGLITVTVIVWLLNPKIGFILFVSLSSYHFGQSQFSQKNLLHKSLKVILYFAWGSSILSALCVYNKQEIIEITSTTADLFVLQPLFTNHLFPIALWVSSSIFFIILLTQFRKLKQANIGMEIVIFMLVHLSFYFHSAILGFSIFFVSIHSFDVLLQEFKFLTTRFNKFTLKKFIGLLAPYTLVSVFGMGFLVLLSHIEVLDISKTLLIFISIAALTLPHSIVMENFYRAVKPGINN